MIARLNIIWAEIMSRLAFLNPWREHRLESYILKVCITAMAGSLLVVSSIILLIDYMEISKAIENANDVNGLTVLFLLIQKSPSAVLILLPFAFLFGSQFAFVNLNRRSELIAMRAAGVSAWRFILPATAMAFAFGVFTITILNPVTAWMKESYDQTMVKLEGNQDLDPLEAIYLRQGDGKQQVVIRAEKRDLQKGTLIDASFWVYSIDKKEVPRFLERIDAKTANLRLGEWELKDAFKSAPGEPELYYDKLSIPSNLNPQTAFKAYNSTQSVPFWQLPGLIYQTDSSGFSSNLYRLKLYELLATPLMFAAMTALGAVFSLRLMRLGGITKLVVSGLGLGFTIFFVNQLFTSMGKADVIPSFLATWSPPLLAMMAAMTLLVYTEDG